MTDFLDGPDFYDSPEIFDVYTTHRQNRDETPNDTMEGPVIWELMGDVENLQILDLGCGDGSFGLKLSERGAASYKGIDGSKNMIELAHSNLEGSLCQVEQGRIENYSFPQEAFDLVISRLALHYIADIERVFQNIYFALKTNGRLIFSIEHPVITSSEKRWEGKGKRQDWLVDNYFAIGRRENSWLGGKVLKYHRTIEQYFSLLQGAGFMIESLQEATPVRENFKREETFLRRQRIPLFLIMAGRKHE